MNGEKNHEIICVIKNNAYLCTRKYETSRSGAVVARWAHNPKVVGSNPSSATNSKVTKCMKGGYLAFFRMLGMSIV